MLKVFKQKPYYLSLSEVDNSSYLTDINNARYIVLKTESENQLLIFVKPQVP